MLSPVDAVGRCYVRCGGDVPASRTAEAVSGSVQKHQHYNGVASEGRKDL